MVGAEAFANDSWKTVPTHFTGHHTHISPVGQLPSSKSGTPSNFKPLLAPLLHSLG